MKEGDINILITALRRGESIYLEDLITKINFWNQIENSKLFPKNFLNC